MSAIVMSYLELMNYQGLHTSSLSLQDLCHLRPAHSTLHQRHNDHRRANGDGSKTKVTDTFRLESSTIISHD